MKRQHMSQVVGISLLVGAIGLASACTPAHPGPPSPSLAPDAAPASSPAARPPDSPLTPDTWAPGVREEIDKMIARHKGRAATDRPVALFDWDNTVIYGDSGDATYYWMVENGRILQPPGGDWHLVSPFLSEKTAERLRDACNGLSKPGEPLPTSPANVAGAACAAELVRIYKNGSEDGSFTDWNHRTMEPAYAWAVQVLAGYRPDEISKFAREARNAEMARPLDPRSIGGVSVKTAVRLYRHMKQLVADLQSAGFDIWIISASPQLIVEAFSDLVNIPSEKVIGIRNVERNGKLTYDIQGCGDIPDGANHGLKGNTGNSMITFIDGKRCWVNSVVFKVSGSAALQLLPDSGRRQVFAAGDSVGDITFLRDATELRLVLNRNKPELMCYAYGQQWLVNWPFINPPMKHSGYACNTSACTEVKGSHVPCQDDRGTPIADQADKVFYNQLPGAVSREN